MTMLPRKYQSFLLLVACLALTGIVTGQQYDQDYPEYQEYADNENGADNLYADYAAHQQDKQGGGG
jgi:hypothetical protein